MRPTSEGGSARLSWPNTAVNRGQPSGSICDHGHLLWTRALGRMAQYGSPGVFGVLSSDLLVMSHSWILLLPDLSVIIATHNRAELFSNCLSAVLSQTAGERVEVIVVDSASDHSICERTKQEIENQRARYNTPIKFAMLAEPGVAKARNAGLEHAEAPWIATLDDDAVVRSGWIKGALNSISDASPDTALIQGRINPKWPASISVDVGPRWQRFLSVVQLEGQFEMTEDLCCSGANMLLRKEHLVQAGGFDEEFGRVKNNLQSGIDTALANAMLNEGGRIFYSDQFPVDHVIHSNRLNQNWLSERSKMDGRAAARLLVKSRKTSRILFQLAKSIGAVSFFSLLLLLKPKDSEILVRRDVSLGLLAGLSQGRKSSAKEC